MGQLCMNPDCRETQHNYWLLAKKYEELKKKSFEQVGWKGKDVISITKSERGFWTIISHQKDRSSGVVKELSHDVPDECVKVMREGLFVMFIEYHEALIKGKGKVARHLKNWLIKKWSLDFKNEKEFFGSRKEYFKYYYHALVILAYFGLVEYESSGNITLTEHFFEQKNNNDLVMWKRQKDVDVMKNG